MARISNITMAEQPSYCILAIRKTIDFMVEFSEFSQQSFRKISNYLEEKGILSAGAPIVCFHNMDLEKLDVEVGFPVANHSVFNNMDTENEILQKIVPTQKIITAIDLGPYELQDPTLEELFLWAKDSGYELYGDIYYQYLNDLNRPESEYLTKMMLPIL
ncbi:GyrI-like domain-containing protein [Clostridioides sp. ES-S-0123-01]|uniref:GyrI-like domain-containing protein n=1 Tax=unclassified Clostridioides TaxID=2635829 RepID=UPI001D111D91|nr:GyrI-like domain-containing protein [Clostridioides sp. ES-S-0123-01]MCC0697033.1 GyrI-like domain-containing protein [Clostridioides sp. ES-S-0048-02]